MNEDEFSKVCHDQNARSMSLLLVKAAEYATEDRLHNFKVAATMQGVTPIQALAGMMAKHSVSLYDMMRSGKAYSMDVWNEKITDHINYLLLLKGLVVEQNQPEKENQNDDRSSHKDAVSSQEKHGA